MEDLGVLFLHINLAYSGRPPTTCASWLNGVCFTNPLGHKAALNTSPVPYPRPSIVQAQNTVGGGSREPGDGDDGPAALPRPAFSTMLSVCANGHIS